MGLPYCPRRGVGLRFSGLAPNDPHQTSWRAVQVVAENALKHSYDDDCWQNETTRQRPLKIVLLGDSSVGKTSLMNKFANANFRLRPTQSTHHPDFVTKEIAVDNRKVMVQLWDVAPQGRFYSLGVALLRGAHACLLVV